MNNQFRQPDGSVYIDVPAAAALGAAPVPLDKDTVIQMQDRLLTETRSDLQTQRLAASQCAHVALALAAKLISLGEGIDVDTVCVPVELRDRYEGGHLTIDEGPDRSYVIRIRERNVPERMEMGREA